MPDEVAVAAVTPTIAHRPLPRVRQGYRIDVEIGGTPFSIAVNVDSNQRLGEVHMTQAKHGSFGHGMVEAFAELLSDALRYGMPLDDFVERFLHTRFEPSGFTDDPDVRWVKSPLDYLARRLATDFLSTERQATLGVLERRSAAAA